MDSTEEALESPYTAASYIAKLREKGVMVLTDLDGTMTAGTEMPGCKELSDRAAVRALIRRKDVAAGAVTARTCALTLSSAQYDASPEVKKAEPAPRWGVDPDTGKHTFVPLESVPHFAHCLDWDFTASFGSRIIVRNCQGYRVDRAYERLLAYDYAQGKANQEPWRHAMLLFLLDHCAALRPYMSALESQKNYDEGLTNVAPLDFRYQLDFWGESGRKDLEKLLEVIDAQRMAGNPVVLRIATVDESRIDESNPEKSRYTLYLIPWGARKEKMIHRLFSQSALAAGRATKDIRLFYAGDTFTDLRTGLYAGGDAPLTFLLPTGSRLAPYLIGRKPKYGTEDLSFLWANHERYRQQPRLVPTAQTGVYRFIHKIRGPMVNTIVIGDERYPGRTSPGSVAEFLDEFVVV